MPTETHFELRGFPSKEAAMQRSRELAVEQGLHAPGNYWFRWEQRGSSDWALVITPGQQGVLREDERARLLTVQQKKIPINVHPTPVYRYLVEMQHVDDFFKTGNLFINWMEGFRQHPDEQFRDELEGENVLGVTGKDSTLYVRSSHGASSFILSATYLPPTAAPLKFAGLPAIEIRNPLKFAIAVANCLTGCEETVVGACAYNDNLSISTEVPGLNFERLHKEGRREDLLAVVDGLVHYVPMFRKRTKYRHEQEYRIVWRVNVPVTGATIISCPEAISFCRPAQADTRWWRLALGRLMRMYMRMKQAK